MLHVISLLVVTILTSFCADHCEEAVVYSSYINDNS